MSENKTAIAPCLALLQPGESVTYPIQRINVVKNTASIKGVELGRTFATAVDRQAGTITVTRKS